MNDHERENYSWGVLQSMIEREIHEAFKIKEPQEMPSKKKKKINMKILTHIVDNYYSSPFRIYLAGEQMLEKPKVNQSSPAYILSPNLQKVKKINYFEELS